MTSTAKEATKVTAPQDKLILRRGTDGRYTAMYVGYPLALSPAEGRILETLLAARERGEEDYISVETLQEAGQPAGLSDGQPPSAAQVSVLVNRINRKAREIGGRPLIECRRLCGFRVNATP